MSIRHDKDEHVAHCEGNELALEEIPETSITEPKSHRMRFLHRMIGCKLAKERQSLLRSPAAVAYCDWCLAGGKSSYDWSYAWIGDHKRLENIDGLVNRR